MTAEQAKEVWNALNEAGFGANIRFEKIEGEEGSEIKRSVYAEVGGGEDPSFSTLQAIVEMPGVTGWHIENGPPEAPARLFVY